MKKILVLTDFSENATCAAEAALVLSAKLRTDILLFHTYIDYTGMPSYPGGGWIVDEFTARKHHSKQGLGMLMEGLESISDTLDPEDRRPAIYSQSDDCDLGMDVADIIREKDIELVVMGSRSEMPDNFPPGTNTNSVLSNATRPVLIIPAHTNLKQIRKVIFATDFSAADFKAIHYLVKLGKLFDYQIEIIHVTEPNKNGTAKNEKTAAFKDQIAELKYEGLWYREVEGKDVTEKLAGIISESGSGLLAMLHRQYPFFIRIFKHSETKKALERLKIPLLVFPSKMK